MIRTDNLAWGAQPRRERLYVIGVIVCGAIAFGGLFPLAYPRPLLFAALIVSAGLTSLWKVNLPISLTSGATLSVSYAANLMALLLLGPRPAVVVAVAGVVTQCTYRVKRRYPVYRMLFSASAEAITMAVTGFVYESLGAPAGRIALGSLAAPLVIAIVAYFVANTGLVAGAIALSTGRSWWRVWRDDFLWSGASFIVAGSAGAAAAVVIDRDQQWAAVFMLAPVYLTYRTYRVFIGRLEDRAALAAEKERLAEALREMTRLEAAREQLLEREQAARASAEHANRLKDQFLAIVSHELRTPLNAILGWADMLRRDGLDSARRPRAFNAIYDSARRQSQLIDDLLDVSRIMSGKLQLARTAVDVTEIVRAVAELVQPAADDKRIALTIEADGSARVVHGDGARLQQIVSNLLSNAIKFTPEGGSVHVRLHQIGRSIELAVTDTGIGIPRDFLTCVFEPFRQVDASRTRTYGGLGLGLAIVKHLVEAHGGTVTADSPGEGRGTTFTVRLVGVATTVHENDQTAMPVGAAALTGESTSLEGVRVLVVDDDEQSREVMAVCLQSHHAEVLEASSAGRALSLLERQRVDVLLSDLAMPGEDGYSLLRKVRMMRGPAASIPAVAVTAFARREDREQALQAGFQLHLAKPLDADSLVAAVARLARSGTVPEMSRDCPPSARIATARAGAPRGTARPVPPRYPRRTSSSGSPAREPRRDADLA